MISQSRQRARRSRFPCPNCGSRNTVPIIYGMPPMELAEKAETGALVLGGCCLEIGDPDRHCHACSHEWLRDNDDRV